ncbi:MAG: C45 family peptidase [Candidatus Alcyoniella australis]|nr:C45 family peptidase [Candidatus Alcyoniella australis]
MMRYLLALLTILLLCCSLLFALGCDQDDDDDDDDQADDDAVDDDDDDDDDEDWEPVPPHREQYERFSIVWLGGTPYEMGYQHGQLLHEELAAGYDWLNSLIPMDLALDVLRTLGLVDLAYENSYPEVLEECRGLSDAAGDVGWSMDLCLLLNFGDALVEFLGDFYLPFDKDLLQPGCSQAIATGPATADGSLYHARSLDWDKIDFMLDYPVIFVRQPTDGIPHAFIGFPGNLSPYSGINAEGLSIASNEADPLDNSQHDFVGRSHVQLVGHLLSNAHSMDEAVSIVQSTDHMCVTVITVADGVAKRGAVFEMTAQAVGIRELEDGVVWATNHFEAPETRDLDADPVGVSSRLRFDRLEQLLDPAGADSLYGTLDAEAMVGIMRDRVDPYTGLESPADEFDNNGSIATNGAIYQMVFAPADLHFWVAAGGIPVPQQPFVGFSLGELLGLPDAVPINPPIYE